MRLQNAQLIEDYAFMSLARMMRLKIYMLNSNQHRRKIHICVILSFFKVKVETKGKSEFGSRYGTGELNDEVSFHLTVATFTTEIRLDKAQL